MLAPHSRLLRGHRVPRPRYEFAPPTSLSRNARAFTGLRKTIERTADEERIARGEARGGGATREGERVPRARLLVGMRIAHEAEDRVAPIQRRRAVDPRGQAIFVRS